MPQITAAAVLWDVVIVGGGPAGLTAALILGRCRRKVLLFDDGRPRSWATREMHAFPTRDGIPPGDFQRIVRQEIRRYRSVRVRKATVIQVKRQSKIFRIRSRRGRPVYCRMVLMATGLVDRLPPIDGLMQFYGKSVFHCPYCDGWEFRDLPIAVYGRGKHGFEMARAMTGWTKEIYLCPGGPARLTPNQRRELASSGIKISAKRIARLEGSGEKLEAVVFTDGARIRCRALFFDSPVYPPSPLAQSLGCCFGRNGGVRCGKYQATTVPGVFAAGNIVKDVQLSIVAAAEGATAAFGINRALIRENFAP